MGSILHIPMRKAYKGYEKLCTRFKGKDTEYVCDTVFIRYLEKTPGNGSEFKEAVYMPFENRRIPVPVGYDGRLTAEYGDYMKPAKAPTMHGGPILDPDVPLYGVSEKINKETETFLTEKKVAHCESKC